MFNFLKSDESLCGSYKKYINNKFNKKSTKKLINNFIKNGLITEANLLQFHLETENVKEMTFTEGFWKDKKCSLGLDYPNNAATGDLWFDIAELNLMIFVKNHKSPDNDLWISCHPVYNWQFKTFLELVDWKLVQKYFLNVTDLLDKKRFESRNEMDFTTDIYQEEAVCYAHWVGKNITNEFDLNKAKNAVNNIEFSAILPPNLKTWRGVQYGLSEFVRIAFSQDTIDKDIDEEFNLNEQEKDKLLTKMIYKEWDRLNDIGLITKVSTKIKLLKSLPRRGYEFVELLNSMPR